MNEIFEYTNSVSCFCGSGFSITTNPKTCRSIDLNKSYVLCYKGETPNLVRQMRLLYEYTKQIVKPQSKQQATALRIST